MRERTESVLADLIDIRAEQHPDLDVVTFEHLSLDGLATPDEVRTYAQLGDNGRRIAGELVRRGMGRGDRFGLMMRNHPEFVEATIAASASGTVFVPIDPRTRADKLAYMLANSGCRGLICADYTLDEVAAARAAAHGLEWVLALDTAEDAGSPKVADVAGVESLRAVLHGPVPTLDCDPANPEDPVQILYTSGTTGDPKGIVGSNAAFVRGGMAGYLFGYQPTDRPYTGLSLTHGNAWGVTLMPSLFMGLRAVMSRKFTKSKLWDVARHYGCTTFSLVGGMAMALYSEPAKPDDDDNPVRIVVSGGMPGSIWGAFEERFGLQIIEIYGASDGGGLTFKPAGEGPIGSIGKPIGAIEMKVLDENDEECPPGVIGEICCRPTDGSKAEVEYFGNEEASQNKVRGGWNRSGDMAHTDEDGWFFFDYRSGGGIRHNGDFVNSGFVERVIAEHPDVDDVFVYGAPIVGGTPGEKDVVAAVVPADRATFDPQTVFAACRAGLEANFVPSYIQVVDEIPKTASEKPQERLLLDQFNPTAPGVLAEERP
jgi:crotonobetaine/carnitine-CoA ligase